MICMHMICFVQPFGMKRPRSLPPGQTQEVRDHLASQLMAKCILRERLLREQQAAAATAAAEAAYRLAWARHVAGVRPGDQAAGP